MNSKTEVNKTFYQSISYPTFNIKKLDNMIKEYVKDKEDKFYIRLNTYHQKEKVQFIIDYETVLKDERYINIKLNYYENINEVKEEIKTFVYDTFLKKVVSLKDMFKNKKTYEEFIKKYYLTKENFILGKRKLYVYDSLKELSFSYKKLSLKTKEEISVYVPYKDVLNEPVKIIYPKKKMIALTFDDGPDMNDTADILDELKKYNVSATFFVLGSRVDMAPDLLQRMVMEGHEIGNHTYSHKQLTHLKKDKILWEVNETQKAIYNVTGKYPTVIRLPFGEKNDMVLSCMKQEVINWTIDSEDWRSKNGDVIVKKVMSQVKDGDIILFHDIFSSTGDAVKMLIPELIARDYQLVTVSELKSIKDKVQITRYVQIFVL